MLTWRRIQYAVVKSHQTFLGALAHPLAAQEEQLAAILRANQDTVFGRRYGFGDIADADEYRQRVPVHHYEDLAPDIERMAAGEEKRLCGLRPALFEQTAGSTTASKLIPYTEGSLAAFRRALYPWLGDLLRVRPDVAKGRCYWALSPAARTRRCTAGGFPIGMDSDTAYFGAEIAPLLAELFVMPAEMAAVDDIDRWRYLALRFLVEAEDLSLISVWSPTFLFLLLDACADYRDRLARDIELGTISGEASYGEPLARHMRPNAARAAVVAQALSGDTPDTRALWPRLDTLSCWTDGAARRFVARLRDLFPHAWIQGKGLLATEGAVTIPLTACDYPVLALHSGFFEFVDDSGVSRLCHQLEHECSYRVLLTTYGGLYRYELGDRVCVRGWFEATPMLEFLGRAGLVSDVCGEKLRDDFVQERLPAARGFAMLAPALTPYPHYVLFLDEAQWTPEQAAEAAAQVDAALRENPQYDYARRLGQLGLLRALCMDRPWMRYSTAALAAGHRLGDLKPPALRPEDDWETRLATA